MTVDELGLILQNEVNSGFVGNRNHDSDNGFLESKPIDVIRKLEEYEYEAVGICKYVPFPCTASSQSIAFVFKDCDELLWVHMPETYWFSLLDKIYGYDKADEIVSKIMGY